MRNLAICIALVVVPLRWPYDIYISHKGFQVDILESKYIATTNAQVQAVTGDTDTCLLKTQIYLRSSRNEKRNETLI